MTHINLSIVSPDRARLVVDTIRQSVDTTVCAGEAEKAYQVAGGMLTGRGPTRLLDILRAELSDYTDPDHVIQWFDVDVKFAGDEFMREMARSAGINLEDAGDVPEEIARAGRAQGVFVGYSPSRESMVMVTALYSPGEGVEVELGGVGQLYTSESAPAQAAMARRGRSGQIPTLEDQAAMLREQARATDAKAKSLGYARAAAGKGHVVAWEITPEGAERHVVGPVMEQAKSTKVGRNAPCPCGSGRKSKTCCRGAAA